MFCYYLYFYLCFFLFFFFFFQAEDGIRDWSVTRVQTCALPIYPFLEPAIGDPQLAQHPERLRRLWQRFLPLPAQPLHRAAATSQLVEHGEALVDRRVMEIGRASCRERVESAVVGVRVKEKAHGG